MQLTPFHKLTQTPKLMNKIISANIHGFIFPIDEKAYEKLSQYLDALRLKINDTETYTDIENRIAELFDHYLKSGISAILETQVNEVIAQVGHIDEIEVEEPVTYAPNNESNKYYKSKLYRNPDDKVIYGVCGGIGAYLGLNSNLIRIIVSFLFLGSLGTLFLVYMILVLLLPEAQTPAEKLQMKGEPVNLDNLGRVVNSNIKSAFSTSSADSAKQNMSNFKQSLKSRFYASPIVKIIAGIILIGLFLGFIPVLFTAIFSAGAIAFMAENLQQYFFLGLQNIVWPISATLVLICIPLIHLVYNLFRIVLNGKRMIAPLRWILNLTWFTSVIYMFYLSILIGKEFSNQNEVTHTVECNEITSDSILYIQSTNPEFSSSFQMKVENSDEIHDEKITINGNNLSYLMKNRLSNGIDLKFVTTSENKPFITLIKKSRGSNNSALAHAAAIKYNFKIDSNHILLDHYFSLGNQPWRNQQLDILINLPVGIKVKLDKSCENMLEQEEEESDEDEIFTSQSIEIQSTNKGIKIIR